MQSEAFTHMLHMFLKLAVQLATGKHLKPSTWFLQGETQNHLPVLLEKFGCFGADRHFFMVNSLMIFVAPGINLSRKKASKGGTFLEMENGMAWGGF